MSHWDFSDMERYLKKWQEILRLKDWDIIIHPVEKEWRKTGDIKIDRDDRNAVLMINVYNPKQTNLEGLIIHELLHLKLWDMDQMIEGLINLVYGTDESDPKRDFAYTQFMTTLESTVQDLAKGYLQEFGEDKTKSFGRIMPEVLQEIGE